MPNPSPLILDRIVEQHTDETAFLYTQRKNAACSFAYKLSDLVELDNRLNGNINGLLCGGEGAWESIQTALAFEGPGELFAAASYCVARNDYQKLEQVLEAAGEKPELLDAIADAFISYPFNRVHSALENLFHLKGNARRYVVIAALAGHGQRINHLNQTLSQALQSANPLLIQRTLLAIGQLGLHEFGVELKAALTHDNENVKFAAAWSATRLGMAAGMEALKQFVKHPEFHAAALAFVVMQKDRNETANILRDLYQDNASRRYAISGLGYLGNPVSIRKLIDDMAVPAFARIAGAAFSHITGLDLMAMGMDTEAPADFSAGPDENPEDDNVAMDPDEDLPWPDKKKISEWWQWPKNQEQYQQASHYFLGAPLTENQLQKGLRTGNQVQRQYAALILATQDRTSALFNVYAPSKRQLELLA